MKLTEEMLADVYHRATVERAMVDEILELRAENRNLRAELATAQQNRLEVMVESARETPERQVVPAWRAPHPHRSRRDFRP